MPHSQCNRRKPKCGSPQRINASQRSRTLEWRGPRSLRNRSSQTLNSSSRWSSTISLSGLEGLRGRYSGALEETLPDMGGGQAGPGRWSQEALTQESDVPQRQAPRGYAEESTIAIKKSRKALRNKRLCFDLLFDAAAETLLQIAGDKKPVGDDADLSPFLNAPRRLSTVGRGSASEIPWPGVIRLRRSLLGARGPPSSRVP